MYWSGIPLQVYCAFCWKRRRCFLTGYFSPSPASSHGELLITIKNSLSVIGHWIEMQLIVMLHKYIICFDLDMYFLIDSNMSTTVVAINKHMHLVMFYYFAVINCKYHNLLKSYIHLNLAAF